MSETADTPASTDPATPPEPQPPAAEPPTPNPTDDDTGGKGSKQQVLADLASERKKRQALEAELDELRTAALDDHERAVKEAADNARRETLGEVNKRLFAAELRAATVGKIADPELLADPEVAVRLLGLDEIPVTPSGDIDTEAISASVASLLEAKPYLAGVTPQGPEPVDLGQGARGTHPNRQLTRADLQRMSPEQIDKARKDGQLDDLLAGKG